MKKKKDEKGVHVVHAYGVIMIQLEEYYTLYLQGGLSLKGEIKNFTNNEE